MKWFILALALIVSVAISFNYMGGAGKAASNYSKLLHKKQ